MVLGKSSLSVEDFDYSLPASAIAHHACEPRDTSRLCLRDAHGEISHHHFFDLPQLLSSPCHLVMNDTAVFPARFFAKDGGGKEVDLVLLAPPVLGQWVRCLGKPSKVLRCTSELFFADGKVAQIRTSTQSGLEILWQGSSEEEFQRWCQDQGCAPLPPYMPRRPEPYDLRRYQSVYACGEALSIAAPTAGLHMSEKVLSNLKNKGVSLYKVRLHIGRGTFTPVRSVPENHVMHRESYTVPKATFEALWQAHLKGEPIILLGTTTLRALESLGALASRDPARALELTDQPLSTDLFIYPQHTKSRYSLWLGDGLITNFHAPRSTLFMLICALIGFHQAHQLYHQALKEGYRFLSYGDSSLLLWE